MRSSTSRHPPFTISGRIHVTAPAVKRQKLMGGDHAGAFPEDRAHRRGHRQSLDAPGLERQQIRRVVFRAARHHNPRLAQRADIALEHLRPVSNRDEFGAIDSIAFAVPRPASPAGPRRRRSALRRPRAWDSRGCPPVPAPGGTPDQSPRTFRRRTPACPPSSAPHGSRAASSGDLPVPPERTSARMALSLSFLSCGGTNAKNSSWNACAICRS